MRKIRNTEVKWHQLSDDDKLKFEKAKETEVNQWIAAAAIRKAVGPVPRHRLVSMRWVLTWKENGAAKGRIVLIGYQDPDLDKVQSSAPTMTRLTRGLALQFASVKGWRTLKADVKAAFLQGFATEEGRNLFAIPVPELAAALGLRRGEVVQVLKGCYGLVTAPASWFQCVRDTLAELGWTQSLTDPCLWFLYRTLADGSRITTGFICAHVDDFLIAGDEQDEELGGQTS